MNKIMYSGLRLFKTAFLNTRRQIYVSGILLVTITFVLTVIMYLAESAAQSDFSFWDAFIWPYEKYLGDPAEVTEAPVTVVGKIIGTLVGIMGVAIFAVPAGLIGSGLTDAMDEEKRTEELKGFRRRMQKAFRRQSDKTLREYLNTLPDGGGEKLKTLNFVPQRVLVARMQVRQGMDLKDIIDTCNEFPEFRLNNLADALSDEENAEDRFLIEHYPLNRKYGFCVNRHSRVTIVSTSSFSELSEGWFTYYLAKFGGFNYISKEIEVDTDELDSYYNLNAEPLYDKKPLSAYDPKKDKEACSVLQEKQACRDEFLGDLKDLTLGDGSWAILFTAHMRSKVNQVDFHLAHAQKNDAQPTVDDLETYGQLCDAFATTMKQEFDLDTDTHSKRYPLLKKNLGYTIRELNPGCNVFVMRPSSQLVNFDIRRLVIALRMAQLISQHLDNGQGMTAEDVQDFKQTGFGYTEKGENYE